MNSRFQKNISTRAVWCAVLLLGTALVSGCGGGSDGGGNSSPTASFTASVTSGTAPLAVDFNASASSDSDGIAIYSWNFGDGSAAASGVTTSHTFTTGGSFTVTLTVTDTRGATGQTTRAVQVTGPPAPPVTVSGIVTYDRVPFSTSVSASAGLDYAAVVARPVRGAVAELLDTGLAVLATTTTSETGQYSFSSAPANTNVTVRIKAQSVATGSPGWSVSVLNNTNSSALYALDSTAFNTGPTGTTRDLHAPSGWPGLGGTSYTGNRTAAPFAILDTLYSAVQFVVSDGSATVNLPALQVFWSSSNKPSDVWNPATGDIQSTLYQSTAVGGFPSGIYVLGWQNVDTDEYDPHVIAHEFQHFLENTLSRSDSPGGDHALGEKLDMRLAFSEGFANAFSAMVLDDPLYRDSFDPQQGSSFYFNVESGPQLPQQGPLGWFNEGSIQALAWDMYDDVDDGADAVQIGYAPLFSVFRNELRTGQALTSFFPLATALKGQAGAPVAALNALIAAQSIRASDIDAFGSTETNDGNVPEALPLYTDIAVNGPARTVCGSATAGTFNKIGNSRFLKFSLAGPQTITIRVTSFGSGLPTPDPDFWLFGDGSPQVSDEATPNVEEREFSVPAGGYVIEVYEYSHIDPSASGNISRGTTCMNVSVTG